MMNRTESVAPHAHPHRSVVVLPSDDYLPLLHVRVNVMIAAPADRIAAALGALGARGRVPFVEWAPGDPLPPPADGRTVLIRDVATLPIGQQRAWLSWLGRRAPGGPQVISTSTVPVYPLVQRGEFLGSLYYRLNTILIEDFDRAG